MLNLTLRFCLLAGLVPGSVARLAAAIAHPRIQWAFQTEGSIRGAAALAGDALYFGSADGFVYALGKRDGALRWKFDTGASIAGAPAVANGLVIVTGRSETVHALDAAEGKVRWTFAMQPTLPTPTEWNYFTAPPVVQGDTVFVASGDGHLYALELASGKKRWAFRTGDSLRAAPLVAGDTIYQPSGDDHVYALAVRDGALRWKFATVGVGYDLSSGFIRSDIFTRPALQDGVLVFGSRDGNVYAVDATSGEKKWTFSYDSTWAMSSTIARDTVFVGWSTNNKINALDLATGAKKWEFSASSHTYTTAVVDEADSYWCSADGKIYNLDPKTGALKWTYAIGSEIYSSPVGDGDTLYFGTDDGRMLAVAEGAAETHKAVYVPAKVPGNIAGFVIDPSLAPYLVERGYTHLDSPAALAEWIEAHTKDNAPSVVVFGFAQIPPAVIGEEPARGPLRAYLAAGGKVVWPWGIPNQVTFDDEGKFLAYDPTVAARLLELEFVGFQDSGNYFARSTTAGRNWGMPAWLKTGFASLPSANGVTALAHDEYGRVSAFVKSFHPRIGAGWVTYSPKGFGVGITPAQLATFERVASYGIE